MLSPPRTLRETFELLALLDRVEPLERLLERVDWSGVTPQQVAHAVLGRLPEELHYSGLAEAAFEPRSHFASLLLGAEFQSEIVPSLLGAFPDKPRRFFVHVPRCGGTSLGETLAMQACTVPHNALGTAWCSGRAFLDDVADICRGIPRHEAIHVSGHYSLRSAVDARLVRFGDCVWTSVRPPRALVLSYMNYILTVLDADPDFTRPDTQRWAELLAVKLPFSRLSGQQRRALLPRMTRDGRVIPRDLICHFLGDGTAESALDLLAAGDVEVIDAARLDQWREQRWSVPAPPWRNVSTPFFRWNQLDRQERHLVDGLIREDLVLHRVIEAATAGQPSVRGLQLAHSPRRSGKPDGGLVKPGRTRRAARPILLDAMFHRLPSGEVGWADPPLDYRTIETTLRFPLFDTRIRVRYVRRPRRHLVASSSRDRTGWWRRGVAGLVGRVGSLLARSP